MSLFKIDKKVPTPKESGMAIWPWKEMKVGDSFFSPGERKSWAASAKQQGFKCSTRQENKDGVAGYRVWRTA
jgi:hypothetical protein